MKNQSMSGAQCVSGAYVANPFILAISGPIGFGVLSSSGATVVCASGAEIRWMEQKIE